MAVKLHLTKSQEALVRPQLIPRGLGALVVLQSKALGLGLEARVEVEHQTGNGKGAPRGKEAYGVNRHPVIVSKDRLDHLVARVGGQGD